jgi:hypothetical protein
MRFLFYILLIGSFTSIVAQKKWSVTEEDSLKNARLLYDEGNYDLALPIFEVLYKNHSDEFFLKFIYGNCALSRSDKHETALELLNEVYAKNKKAEDIELNLARALHYNYKFDSALVFIDMYLSQKKLLPEKRKYAEQIKKYIANANFFYTHPGEAKITNVGNTVNTESNEYAPVITADESTIIYTYEGSESNGGRQNAFQEAAKNGKFYEDVFSTEKVAGSWVKPSGVAIINTNVHDAAIAVSSDGTRLFTYRNEGEDKGDIYVSYLEGKDWTSPVKLKGQVNSTEWEGSCSLTSDGQTLYFSSERPGGKGGRDIYRASLLADSTWGKVVNLGDSINTIYDDDAPFIHADGVTLFYSSKGRNSMGDYDIFQSVLNPLDSVFSSPINLGYPINTPGGDRYYVVSADGQTGYYSSEKKGGLGLNDIYSVDPGYVGKKPVLYLVKGVVTLDGIPIDSKILVDIISKNDKRFSTIIPNKVTGEYLVTLPSGEVYKLTFMHKDSAWKILRVDASAIQTYVEEKFDYDFNPKFVFKELRADSLTEIAFEKSDSTQAKNTALLKTQKFCEKYGDIASGGLIFKVQVAAYKYRENYSYKHLNGLGKIETLVLNDGITRITMGGNFDTISKAYEYCKKVLEAGQKDAFVTAIYKGKRVYLEELEALGIFK